MEVRIPYGLLVSFVLFSLIGCHNSVERDLPNTVDFNFHVKPILSDRCFQCHGPDANTREADLRLDDASAAFNTPLESGGYAIVPGKPHKSELLRRITSADPTFQMPPVESNLSLSATEIAILEKWIEQGAEYKPHWSFLSVQEVEPPAAQNKGWVHNPIDQFVLSRMEDQALRPEREADKEVLLRRVTLDLTGLPPTIEEIDAFLADDSPEAYEKAVDRLMATDAYAERMAMEWMDVARYADSHGYSLDGYRYMWPWRDWVIDAFRHNMPFDEFVTWQLAGDLLPGASRDQRLATAFLRNQRLNAEGGIVPEEYLVEYAVDRTVTVSTAFMGITAECARCHDHKYDPISQREFFELYAFFNNVNELGEIRGDGNDGPQVLITTEEIDAEIDSLEQSIENVEWQMQERAGKVISIPEMLISLDRGLVSYLDFEDMGRREIIDRAAPKRKFSFGDGVEVRDGYEGRGLAFTPYDPVQYPVEFAQFDRADPFAFSFWVRPSTTSGSMSLLMKIAGKNDSQRGYDISLAESHLSVQLISSYPANRIAVRSQQQLPEEEWTHVVISYDGSGREEGISIYLNGYEEKKTIYADLLSQSIVSKSKPRPLRIGWKWMYMQEVDEGYAVIDELRIYNRSLSGLEAALLFDANSKDTLPDSLKRIHYLTQQDIDYRRLLEERRSLLQQRNQVQDTLHGVMVMEDLPEPRPAFILDRGAYDAPGERVYPSAPTTILPFESELPKNRLGFAQWLMDERHPLTARVTVNRYWQLFFGRGLVETVEDFGNQGALPSHPHLLDWLALTFIKSGWDIQAMQRLIVTSATYQQHSAISPEKRSADPDNIWLARGPRHRLSGEMLRDQALAASGLLVRTVGGPPVKPYQPPGLWAEKSEFTILNEYIPDEGSGRYRRALYTFWRRTSPPPSMILFDAPTRDNCTVRRQNTTTPFQAMVLLNDPQFVEAARALAQRVRDVHPGDVREQIVLGYRLLTGSRPDTFTLDTLVELFQNQTQAFEEEAERDGKELFLDGTVGSAELAAMVVVKNTMMSFQESVYKQ